MVLGKARLSAMPPSSNDNAGFSPEVKCVLPTRFILPPLLNTGSRHIRLRAIPCTLLLALVAAAFAQTPPKKDTPASRPGKYQIAGTVLDAANGELVPEAVVSIGKSQSADALQSVRTGEDGRFRFEALDAGKYWLRAEAHGYAQQGFDEHQGFFTGIVTGGAVDAEHLVFRLRPDAAISGDVIDDANEPVREAQMILLHKQLQDGREVIVWYSTAMTNDEGHYRFGHLQPGTYFVAVRAHPWYAQNQQRVRVSRVVRSVEGSAN